MASEIQATTVKATNLKANDGTTGITVANSTGNVSLGGTLATTGNTTVGGTLTSTGAITASGGIANAGTISAGTLGSSVVFPAGAIVQKITKEVANTQISSSHSSNFPNHIGNYDINITPKYSDSKIIITFTSSIYPNNNGVHSYFTFSRDSETYFGHASEGIALHQAGSDGMGRWNTFFMNYIDTPGTSGSAITYKLHARVSSGAVFVTYGNGYRSTMMLEEIKQ